MSRASSAEAGPIVDIRVSFMGRDAVFLVTGGTAHIGATATACFVADGDIRTEVSVLPGHREGELAEQLAGMAARRLRRTVAVLVGIHLDRPSRQDIMAVVDEAKAVMVRTLEYMAFAGKP